MVLFFIDYLFNLKQDRSKYFYYAGPHDMKIFRDSTYSFWGFQVVFFSVITYCILIILKERKVSKIGQCHDYVRTGNLERFMKTLDKKSIHGETEDEDQYTEDSFTSSISTYDLISEYLVKP